MTTPGPDFNNPEGVTPGAGPVPMPAEQRVQVFDLHEMTFVVACYPDGRTLISGSKDLTPAGLARNLRMLADHLENTS
jgi:hypothetical protein